MTLKLSQSNKNEMFRHAEEMYPEECCGFIFGRDGMTRRATGITRVANVRKGNRSSRFLIDPSDYRKAEAHALEYDLELLGVYHSHPDHPAMPSEHDLKSALPWFSYIIVSVFDGSATDLRSWRLGEEWKFKEETVATDSISSDI